MKYACAPAAIITQQCVVMKRVRLKLPENSVTSWENFSRTNMRFEILCEKMQFCSLCVFLESGKPCIIAYFIPCTCQCHFVLQMSKLISAIYTITDHSISTYLVKSCPIKYVKWSSRSSRPLGSFFSLLQKLKILIWSGWAERNLTFTCDPDFKNRVDEERFTGTGPIPSRNSWKRTQLFGMKFKLS